MPELAQQIPRKDNKKSSHSQAKCDYRHLDLITPQDVSYHENQEYSPHRVPAELIRNCQSVPLDLSMSTIHRSTHNPVSPCTQGPFPMSLSNPGGSSLGSIRALPVGSHHFVSHNSFLGHEAINGILHGTGNPSTKSQEIIKRALSLIQSNNNLGH